MLEHNNLSIAHLNLLRLRCQSATDTIYVKNYESGLSTALNHILLLDDCFHVNGKYDQNSHFMDLMFNNKHYHTTCILTMQYPIKMMSDTQIDYVFLFANDYSDSLRKIYSYYANFFPTYNSFLSVFKLLTADYGCMVIKNRGNFESIMDRIVFYKSPLPLTF